MAVNKINLRIGGPAGYGIMNTGLMFSKACTRIGLHIFDYIEYPSLIRGGHNTYLIRAEDRPVRSHIKLLDVLIALDEPTLSLHADELKEETIIIYDDATIHPEHTILKRGLTCPVPLKAIVEEVKGPEIMQNTVALAAALGLFEYPFPFFEAIIRESFGNKKGEIVDQNVAVAKKGYDYAQVHYAQYGHYRLQPITANKKMVLTGNESIALGAVKAGMKFYAAYPMTPASTLLHTLAAWQQKYGYVVKHAEDEIGVINMGVGAGYAGVRSMVGTSGGGFALMNEAVSLAAMTETPLVIVEVQRPGPASGMPTWTEQGDLLHILNSGHGEFTRFVLAPGDVEECFWLTIDAFNIAEKYQTPVFILSDKFLGESHASVELFDQTKVMIDRGKLLKNAPQRYLRYALTADGISPRVLPGTPDGFSLTNSYEHDEYGWTTEDPAVRIAQVEKRARKEATYRKEMPLPTLQGPENADLTIVSWGSTKGPILDAMRFLNEEGVLVNFLQLTHLSPFPAEGVAKILKNAKRTLLVENNATGQLGQIIKFQTGIDLKEMFLKYDGRPFMPEEIHDKVKGMIR